MISNVLTVGLFPKSTLCWTFLISAWSLARNVGLLSRMPKMLSQLCDGLPSQVFRGCFQIRWDFFYSNTNVWTHFDSYLLKVQDNHLVFETLEMKGCFVFCRSIKGLIQFLKADPFCLNGLAGKTLWIRCCLHAFYHLQPTGTRDFSRVYWGVIQYHVNTRDVCPSVREENFRTYSSTSKSFQCCWCDVFSRKIMTCHHLHWLDVKKNTQHFSNSQEIIWTLPSQAPTEQKSIIIAYTTLVGGFFTTSKTHLSQIGALETTSQSFHSHRFQGLNWSLFGRIFFEL